MRPAPTIDENDLLRVGGRAPSFAIKNASILDADPETRVSPWRFLPSCNRSAEILDN